jgi:hypothetical protein
MCGSNLGPSGPVDGSGLPDIDDRLVEPETGYEMDDGDSVHVPPADTPSCSPDHASPAPWLPRVAAMTPATAARPAARSETRACCGP